MHGSQNHISTRKIVWAYNLLLLP